MENFYKYYCLVIVMSITFFNVLNIKVNTVMKYYHNQAINRKLKLMAGAMNLFREKLLCLKHLALWPTVLRKFF